MSGKVIKFPKSAYAHISTLTAEDTPAADAVTKEVHDFQDTSIPAVPSAAIPQSPISNLKPNRKRK